MSTAALVTAPEAREWIGFVTRTTNAAMLAVLGVIALLPFGTLLTADFGIFKMTVLQACYWLLLGLALAKVVLGWSLWRPGPFIACLLVFAVYAIVSVLFYGVSLVQYVGHARFYMPFVAACALLFAGFEVHPSRLARVLLWGVIGSGTLAIVFHYLAPSVVEGALADSRVLAPIVIGRLYWPSVPVVLIVLFYFLSRNPAVTAHRRLRLVALAVALTAALLTLNRTIPIALLVMLLGYMMLEGKLQTVVRRGALSLAVLAGLLGLLGTVALLDARVYELTLERYLGGAAGVEAVYTEAVLHGRYHLYVQYWLSLQEFFPIGQGLGRPFSWLWNVPYGVTDISFIAFLLPFGLPGLLMFAYFIRTLWRLPGRAELQLPREERRALRLLLLVALLASLNMDLFSRNPFVVLFAALACSWRMTPDAEPAEGVR